eukprot:2731852-Prymnesium_polylepis.1
MEWANGASPPVTYANQGTNGFTMIPIGASDQTTGALPGGSIRFRNVGTGAGNGGQRADLLVTVPQTPASYGADVLAVAYTSPTASFGVSQGLLTSLGFACLGARVDATSCASGTFATVPSTGECADGSLTIMKAAEFSFDFVLPGGTTPLAGFDHPYFLSFFDVDGDLIDNEDGLGAVKATFELHSVAQATELYIASQANITRGVFSPSNVLYALSTSTTNVPTTFAVSPAGSLPASWLPGVVSFKVGTQGAAGKAPAQLRVLLGTKSASTVATDRPFCFAFAQPYLGIGCPSPPPPSAPTSPPAAPPPPTVPPP